MSKNCKTENSRHLKYKLSEINVYGILVGGRDGILFRIHPPLLSRHLVPQNLRNINFLLIFSILGGGPRKDNDLLTSPSNQFRGLFYLKPHRKVSATELELRATKFSLSKNKSTNLFSNLDFWPKSGFPKTWVSSPVAPRGVYISRNDPPKKYGNARKHQKSSFVDKMATFCMPLSRFFFPPPPPIPIPTPA